MLSLYEKLEAKAVEFAAARGITDEKALKARQSVEEALYNTLMGTALPGRAISHSEAITTHDYPQLLQAVINDQILMTPEPDYIGQTLLAQSMNVNTQAGQFKFPAFGYIEAGEVGEGQSFPEQTAELNQNATSIMIKKYGVAVAVSGEMLKADSLGLFGMHVIAARRALARLKEQNIFALWKNTTLPVFDNAQAFGAYLTSTLDLKNNQPSAGVAKFATTGRAIDGTLNGTLSLFDVIDTLAVIMARGYEPTDMMVNPLAWTIFAKNPSLNAFYNMARALPQQVVQAPQYKVGPQAMQSVPLPWNLQMHVTPFVPVDYTSVAATGCPFLTDIYIGSRKNGVILLQGQAPQQEGYQNIENDIYKVRLKEYYGLGLADQGRGWASIKNVRIAESYDIVTVKSIS